LELNRFEDNRQGLHSSNRIGDDSASQAVSLAEAHHFCRQLATSHYENFIVASIFLPKNLRQPFYNIYAYCRHADDLADESPSPEVATRELLSWREQLHACAAGQAEHPIFVALRDTMEQFKLDIAPFDNLLSAFLLDQTKVRYASFDELRQYCQNSADPVGRIILRLADADTPENCRLSDLVCTGLQLANHWQDVARDHQSGRIYLPRDDAHTFGVDLESLTAAGQRTAVRELIRFECERAKAMLCEGKALASSVPRWLTNDVRLFVHGGLATLDAIAKIDYDVLRVRPHVSRFKQLRLMLAAALNRLT
jgi:squalene synthase HpnC